MSVFQDSLKRQAMLNMREKELKGKAVYGVNKFSDWTKEEFLGHLSKFSNVSMKTQPSTSCCHIIYHGPPSQSSWDWRKKHKVTSVKNQGDCGSCWAFASTGVVETQWAIAKKLTSPLELSVQEFVSCSHNAGCNGGTIRNTLYWLENAYSNSSGKKEKYYLLPSSEYPYEERESPCNYAHIEPKTGAQIKCACYGDFRGRENILANYVLTNGSVAVGVDAVLWHDYI
ncbi:Cathepsin O, partial [Paramuricea clavata]